MVRKDFHGLVSLESGVFSGATYTKDSKKITKTLTLGLSSSSKKFLKFLKNNQRL